MKYWFYYNILIPIKTVFDLITDMFKIPENYNLTDNNTIDVLKCKSCFGNLDSTKLKGNVINCEYCEMDNVLNFNLSKSIINEQHKNNVLLAKPNTSKGITAKNIKAGGNVNITGSDINVHNITAKGNIEIKSN